MLLKNCENVLQNTQKKKQNEQIHKLRQLNENESSS